MNAFSFRPAPSYRAASPDEQMTAAFDMPMSLLSTLGQQAKGGILDSFGLGTAVRTVTTPETAPVESGSGIADTLGSINRAIAPENMIRRAIGKGYDGSPVLDEDKYKASAYYREGVKWDAGMTEDRAAALAESFDAKRVRDHFASKRPITAFLGNIAGQALDPINYIPIMGQTVKAANVARFGRVGGAAITNALDAAANTALAGALTYSARKDFGDDITWQSTVSEIAMAALIGGAFGTVSGVLDSRRAARAANATAKASEALSTLKNVQDARIALNSAIDGLVRGEDVNLSANAVDAVSRNQKRFTAYHGSPYEFDAFSMEKIGTGEGAQAYGHGLYFAENEGIARFYRDALSTGQRGSDPPVFNTIGKPKHIPPDIAHDIVRGGMETLDARIAETSAAIDDELQALKKASESDRTAIKENLRLWVYERDELQALRDAGDLTTRQGHLYEVAIEADTDHFLDWDKPISEQSDWVKDGLRKAGYDVDNPAMTADTPTGGTVVSSWNPDDKSEVARKLRAAGIPGIKYLDASSRASDSPDGARNYVVFDDQLVKITAKNGNPLDTSTAKPEPLPAGRAEAEARVATPENYKAASEQYGVNADDGTFIEQADVDRLRNDGRLTPDDEVSLKEAETTYENGVSYGEALKAVVGCLLA